MPLLYYPSPGEIVVCRYDDQVIEPEIRKTRPAMVVGPRLRGRGRLVTVVPLSTTEPSEIRDYHCRIILPRPLPKPFDATTMWAKCDLVSSVSLDRLDRFRQPRERDSPRRWMTGHVSPDQLRDVKRAVLAGLGFVGLTIRSQNITKSCSRAAKASGLETVSKEAAGSAFAITSGWSRCDGKGCPRAAFLV